MENRYYTSNNFRCNEKVKSRWTSKKFLSRRLRWKNGDKKLENVLMVEMRKTALYQIVIENVNVWNNSRTGNWGTDGKLARIESVILSFRSCLVLNMTEYPFVYLYIYRLSYHFRWLSARGVFGLLPKVPRSREVLIRRLLRWEPALAPAPSLSFSLPVPWLESQPMHTNRVEPNNG